MNLPIRSGCGIVLSRTIPVDVKPDIAVPGSSWLKGHPQVNFWFAGNTLDLLSYLPPCSCPFIYNPSPVSHRDVTRVTEQSGVKMKDVCNDLGERVFEVAMVEEQRSPVDPSVQPVLLYGAGRMRLIRTGLSECKWPWQMEPV